MRRIVKGLGLGLARRAARKLVPVVLTLGSGPSGFPRKLSGRRPKLPRQPRRGSCPSGFSKQLSGRRPKLPRQPWQTRAVARARSVILALGAGPSGFPKQFSGRRPKLLRQPPSRSLPSFWRWGLARRASRNKFPSDAKRGSWTPTAMANPRRRTRALRYFGAGGWLVGLPETIFRAKLPRQPWQTHAVARARSVILALGAGPSGFPKQVSERRKAGGSWRPPRRMRPEAYVATRAAQSVKGEDQASGRNGRFINQKRTNCLSSFGLRIADFILPRIRSLSAARPSNF